MHDSNHLDRRTIDRQLFFFGVRRLAVPTAKGSAFLNHVWLPLNPHYRTPPSSALAAGEVPWVLSKLLRAPEKIGPEGVTPVEAEEEGMHASLAPRPSRIRRAASMGVFPWWWWRRFG